MFLIFSSFAYLFEVVVLLIVIFLKKSRNFEGLNGNGEKSCTWSKFCDSSLLFFSQCFSILQDNGGLYFGLMGSSFRADVKCQSNSAAPEANVSPISMSFINNRETRRPILSNRLDFLNFLRQVEAFFYDLPFDVSDSDHWRRRRRLTRNAVIFPHISFHGSSSSSRPSTCPRWDVGSKKIYTSLLV